MAKLIVLIASNDNFLKQEIRHIVEQQAYRVVFWECGNGVEALRYINALQPDLVIIDLHLPGKNIFEVLDDATHMPTVILVADSPEYAVKAFEYHVLDYLMKPLTEQSLNRALQKFTRNNSSGTPAFGQHAYGTSYPSRILVEKGNRMISIPIDKITHLKADKDYTWIHTCTGESYLSTTGIGQLERKFDPRLFIRIHRSYIVNIDYIQELYRDISKLFISLPNDVEINVGRSYLPAVKELIF